MRLACACLALAAGLVAAAPAAAQYSPAIVAAKAAGQIGERYDGVIGVLNASSAVRRQVNAVNIRRRALYAGLARRRGVSPQEVGITAGCQTMARVRVGEYYMGLDGSWRRRAPGQAAPIPDYCRR